MSVKACKNSSPKSRILCSHLLSGQRKHRHDSRSPNRSKVWGQPLNCKLGIACSLINSMSLLLCNRFLDVKSTYDIAIPQCTWTNDILILARNMPTSSIQGTIVTGPIRFINSPISPENPTNAWIIPAIIRLP